MSPSEQKLGDVTCLSSQQSRSSITSLPSPQLQKMLSPFSSRLSIDKGKGSQSKMFTLGATDSLASQSTTSVNSDLFQSVCMDAESAGTEKFDVSDSSGHEAPSCQQISSGQDLLPGQGSTAGLGQRSLSGELSSGQDWAGGQTTSLDTTPLVERDVSGPTSLGDIRDVDSDGQDVDEDGCISEPIQFLGSGQGNEAIMSSSAEAMTAAKVAVVIDDPEPAVIGSIPAAEISGLDKEKGGDGELECVPRPSDTDTSGPQVVIDITGNGRKEDEGVCKESLSGALDVDGGGGSVMSAALSVDLSQVPALQDHDSLGPDSPVLPTTPVSGGGGGGGGKGQESLVRDDFAVDEEVVRSEDMVMGSSHRSSTQDGSHAINGVWV